MGISAKEWEEMRVATLDLLPHNYRNLTLDYPRRTGQRQFRALMEEIWDRHHPDLSVVQQVAAKYLSDSTTRRHSADAGDA